MKICCPSSESTETSTPGQVDDEHVRRQTRGLFLFFYFRPTFLHDSGKTND